MFSNLGFCYPVIFCSCFQTWAPVILDYFVYVFKPWLLCFQTWAAVILCYFVYVFKPGLLLSCVILFMFSNLGSCYPVLFYVFKPGLLLSSVILFMFSNLGSCYPGLFCLCFQNWALMLSNLGSCYPVLFCLCFQTWASVILCYFVHVFKPGLLLSWIILFMFSKLGSYAFKPGLLLPCVVLFMFSNLGSCYPVLFCLCFQTWASVILCYFVHVFKPGLLLSCVILRLQPLPRSKWGGEKLSYILYFRKYDEERDDGQWEVVSRDKEGELIRECSCNSKPTFYSCSALRQPRPLPESALNCH